MYDAVVLTQSSSLIRYAGPYVAIASAREAGYRIKVVEFFTLFSGLLQYLKAVTSHRTRYLIISTTFLYNRHSIHHKGFDIKGARRIGWERFRNSNLNLWLDSDEELDQWFRDVKAILPPGTRVCLAGERVNKIFQYFEIIPENHPLKRHVDLFLMGRDDDLLRSILSDRSDCYQVRKGRFLIGNQAGQFKTRPVPTNVFSTDDDIAENEVLPIEISRGCAFNCAYCNYDKRTVNKAEQARLREQFVSYHDRFGCNRYHFTTDCFNDNMDFVRAFHKTANSLPFRLEWAAYARPDLCVRHPEIIDLMLESGAVSNFFGIETINHRIGKSVGRGVSFDDTLRVFEQFKTKSANHWIKGFFIIGLPNETRESLVSAAKWIETQTLVDAVDAQVLDVEPYADDLKKLADFSAFSSNPGRYGFLELRFEPDYYWRHETLDLYEAYEIQSIWNRATENNPYIAQSTQLSFMEQLMLGVEHSQAAASLRTPRLERKQMHKAHIADYFRRLIDSATLDDRESQISRQRA